MARKEKKYHYIYKTTCLVTNRYYIGMHSTDNLEDGYLGSGKRLWHSIKFYGKENHIKEILEYLPDRSSLKKRENEIVTSDLIKDGQCMNLVIGGFISLSACTKGGIIAGKIQKEKLESDVEYRKLLSEQWRVKLKKLHESGRVKHDGMRGKSQTEETKLKIGKTNSLKQIGVLNSQFGTIWINDTNVTKKIKKEDIDHYLILGWVRGKIKKTQK